MNHILLPAESRENVCGSETNERESLCSHTHTHTHTHQCWSSVCFYNRKTKKMVLISRCVH